MPFLYLLGIETSCHKFSVSVLKKLSEGLIVVIFFFLRQQGSLFFLEKNRSMKTGYN